MWRERKGFLYGQFYSYFMTSVISSLLLFIGMQLYLFLNPQAPFSTTVILLIFACSFTFTTAVGIYFSIKANSIINKECANILLFVSALSRGKYTERIAAEENGMPEDIRGELNRLAVHMSEQANSLQRLADEKINLAQTAHNAAVMEERQRLARDLHDVVSQQLFALNMMSSAAFKVFDSNPALAKKQLEEIIGIAGKAQGEMRALLLHLRPIELSNDSLCDGIIKLIQELKGKTSLQFAASIDEIDDLSTAGQEHLFRIVQEALSNVLRHSHASKVQIILEDKSNYAYLHISDNGHGFDLSVEKITSYGLKTMRERCEEIGGVMEIRSKVGSGTYIDIRVPLKGGKA
ncbi:sensor histidine kinase [Niallia taxi]|uniref:sensor histidine kinase n=1 Tax=Niallia TaxID=2837506 RepID=UPI0030F8C433